MDIRGSVFFNRAACNCKCHKPSSCLHCNCDGYGNCATVIPHPTLENPKRNRDSVNSHEENQDDCGAEKPEYCELCKPKLSLLGSFSSSLSRGLSIKTQRVCQVSDFLYSSAGKRIAKCIASALRSARKKLKFKVAMGNGSSTLTIKRCQSARADPFQRRRDDVGKKQVIAECKGALPYCHLPNRDDDVESEHSHVEESEYSSSDLFELKNLHI